MISGEEMILVEGKNVIPALSLCGWLQFGSGVFSHGAYSDAVCAFFRWSWKVWDLVTSWF